MITIDGVDLQTLGLVAAEVPELRDGVDVDFPTGSVPGRAGVVHLSRRGQPRERRLTVVGTVSAANHSATLAALDTLKLRVWGRTVQIKFGDDATRYFTGRLEATRHPVIAPVLSQRGVQVRWTFLCANPFAYDTTEQTLDFAAGTTTITPLGSAPVLPRIRVVGNMSALTLLYLTDAGIEQGRIELAGTMNGELIIDCATQIITLAGANASDLLTGGDFLSFDARDGTTVAGPQISWTRTGTATTMEAVYRRAWL